MSDRTESEANKAGENTYHADDFAPRVVFLEVQQAVGKAYDRAAATDGTNHGNHRIGVLQGQHIDIVGDNQKYGNQDDRDDGRWTMDNRLVCVC